MGKKTKKSGDMDSKLLYGVSGVVTLFLLWSRGYFSELFGPKATPVTGP